VIGIATIIDNANPGSWLQAAGMLRLCGPEAVLVWFDRGLNEPLPAILERFRGTLAISPRFESSSAAAEWINANCSVLVVGSDECWKFGSKPNELHFPNHYYGAGVHVPLLAIAVSVGRTRYPDCHKPYLREALQRFRVIYTRDRATRNECDRLGVRVAGRLPDPTFVFRLDELPQWFLAHAESSVIGMHRVIACLRTGTPCVVHDKRPKTQELCRDFGLPTGKLDAVTRRWPYRAIEDQCERYRQRLLDTFCLLRTEGMLP
jgi:hypothetical protein